MAASAGNGDRRITPADKARLARRGAHLEAARRYHGRWRVYNLWRSVCMARPGWRRYETLLYILKTRHQNITNLSKKAFSCVLFHLHYLHSYSAAFFMARR